MVSGAPAAAHVHKLNAISSFGVLTRLDPASFLTLIKNHQNLAVVYSYQGIIWKYYIYITSYKGLFFYTYSKQALDIPDNIELITTRKIYIPSYTW